MEHSGLLGCRGGQGWGESFGDRQQLKQIPASAEKSRFGPELRMTARKQAKPNKQTNTRWGFRAEKSGAGAGGGCGRWVTMTASFIKLHAVGEELQFGVKASFKVRPGSNLPILWPRCDISGISPVFFVPYLLVLATWLLVIHSKFLKIT